MRQRRTMTFFLPRQTLLSYSRLLFFCCLAYFSYKESRIGSFHSFLSSYPDYSSVICLCDERPASVCNDFFLILLNPFPNSLFFPGVVSLPVGALLQSTYHCLPKFSIESFTSGMAASGKAVVSPFVALGFSCIRLCTSLPSGPCFLVAS